MEKNWKEIYIEDENACIPELSERERALIDGSAETPQKREVSKLIKKLEVNHLNGKARLLMVRYHKRKDPITMPMDWIFLRYRDGIRKRKWNSGKIT